MSTSRPFGPWSTDIHGLRALSLARLLTLALCLALLAACGDEPGSGATMGTSSADRGVEKSAGPRIMGRAPWFRLTDQTGATLQSEDLLGRAYVANFFFTRCRATCPVQTARLVALQKERADHPEWADAHFISFSVDPAHDTVQTLGAYAGTHDVDPSTWSLLTGERRTIWQISEHGFSLPAGEDPANEAMPISHSAMFVLVGRRGFIRGYFDSQEDEGIDKLKAALAAVLAEPAPKLVPDPPRFDGPWLSERGTAQRKAAEGYETFHDFQFVDRRIDSEIEFVNRCVDDVGKRYLAVHYDHGNGVAVADVDGDGLLDIYFSNQVGSNQLWRNTGDGVFEDITEDAGVAVRDPVGVTASFADTDNDGDPDLFVTTVRGGNYFFVNDGEGSFTDQTKQAGLEYSGHSSAGVFFDYDNDGLLDLFLSNVGTYTTNQSVEVANDLTTWGQEDGTYYYYRGVTDAFSGHLKPKRTERSILYRNLGGNRFKNVSLETGLMDESWTGAATPIDVNRDGWMDLYVLNMQGHDEYYENQKGVVFKKRSREVFPRTPWGSMGVKVFDYDNDGDFDLYITDMHSDMSERIGPEKEKLKSNMVWPESILQSGGQSIFGNAFYRSTGADAFEEVSDATGAENYWPWGISVGDLNADGYDDVFITASMNYWYRYGVNSLLLNEKGKRFVDSEFVVGIEPRQGPLGKAWFDLDCGGDDLGHDGCEGAQGPVTMWAPLGSRGSVFLDLEGDGDLDIVTNECNAEPMMLVSNLSERRTVRWLSVELEGTKSNRDGLGAVVYVTASGRTYMKRHDGQSGYLSQSAAPLYFGLDDASAVERIRVIWPGGREQIVPGPIEIDRLLTVREP